MLEISTLVKSYKLEPFGIAYIGANEGQELDEILEIFKGVKVYLFEPQKEPFNKLVKKYNKKSNLFFYNFGLSSSEQTIEIYTNINNNSMSSSILTPKDHLIYHPGVLFQGKEDIKVKRYIDLNIKDVNFLKIDVQGYELEVLKGVSNFSDIDYIVTEVNRKELYKDCVLIKDLDKYLIKEGFIRVETYWYKRVIPWGDAFYIKKNKISKFKLYFSIIRNTLQNIRGYFFLLSILIRLKVLNN